MIEGRVVLWLCCRNQLSRSWFFTAPYCFIIVSGEFHQIDKKRGGLSLRKAAATSVSVSAVMYAGVRRNLNPIYFPLNRTFHFSPQASRREYKTQICMKHAHVRDDDECWNAWRWDFATCKRNTGKQSSSNEAIYLFLEPISRTSVQFIQNSPFKESV